MKNVIIVETEDKIDFENKASNLISFGYKIDSSSCNSKKYKAIFIAATQSNDTLDQTEED